MQSLASRIWMHVFPAFKNNYNLQYCITVNLLRYCMWVCTSSECLNIITWDEPVLVTHRQTKKTGSGAFSRIEHST